MLIRNKKSFFVLIVVLFSAQVAKSQFFDSLNLHVGVDYYFSTEKYQPFWLMSNKFGTVQDRKTDMVPYLRVSNKHVLAENERQNEQGLYDDDDLTLTYGLSLYNNNHFQKTIVEEGYARLDYRNWSLRAGRFEETTAALDRDLSTGSFGISPNALPIPKVGIAATDYKDVPFTGGWLQFKGTFAHGWLGSNRYVKNSYYHEKTLFLRVGRGPLKVYGGIEHFAEWGGQRNGVSYGTSAKDFWDVFFIRGSAEDAHTGDHRGVIDGGLYWDTKDWQLHAYLQKPFEGKNDIGFRTMSGLTGAIISFKDKYTGLQKILLEVVHTTATNNHVAGNQLESYYNNNVYRSGWEYQDNIIGTPLFMDRPRASAYFPEIQPFNWNAPDSSIPGNSNIISNRIFALHVGALYSITNRLEGKTLLTYIENYGSSNYQYLFPAGRQEIYCLQQATYELPKHSLTLKAAIGFDFGQLSHADVAGVTVGLEWALPSPRNNSTDAGTPGW